METITQTSVNFMVHMEALERAQNILVLIKRAVHKSDKKLRDAADTPFQRLSEKWLHQSEIAAMAAQRLSKIYERQLIDLIVNPI